MTREEAIKILTEIRDEAGESENAVCYVASEEDVEAIDMAIEALSADAITHEIRTETHECVSETHDLISRERTLRAINGYLETIPYIRNTLTDVGRRDATIHCLYIISELPSAEADWIPCSERLPNEERHYLCCYKGYLPFIAHYHDGQWHCIDGTTHVHAWMPLPEPYKGGDTE